MKTHINTAPPRCPHAPPPPQATASDLAQKLYSTPSVSGSARFSKPKLSQTAFTVSHYAGAVTYSTDSFIPKNRDFVVAEHQALLGSSDRAFVASLFPGEAEAAGGVGSGYKFSSVGSRFKRQLGELMEALREMEPHYIRCIKPNAANMPMGFENTNVLHQARERWSGLHGWAAAWLDGRSGCLAGYPPATPPPPLLSSLLLLHFHLCPGMCHPTSPLPTCRL